MPRNATHDFGWAIKSLKLGGAVTRQGWNEKNMVLVLIPGSTFKVEKDRPLGKHLPAGTTQNYLPHIDILTAQGDMVPWLASQSDVLAEDWVVADLAAAKSASAVAAAPVVADKPSKIAKAIARTTRRKATDVVALQDSVKIKKVPGKAAQARAKKTLNGAALQKGA